jgi:hypothetical protein
MFKVDENLPVEVADILRRHALDAASQVAGAVCVVSEAGVRSREPPSSP